MSSRLIQLSVRHKTPAPPSSAGNGAWIAWWCAIGLAAAAVVANIN